MVSQSDSLPITMPTNGFGMVFPVVWDPRIRPPGRRIKGTHRGHAMATHAAPRDTESEMDSAFSRDLYLLAPAALPAGMQYAVSGGDGQVLFFVKRSRRGRFLAALLGSIAVGFLVFGFVS